MLYLQDLFVSTINGNSFGNNIGLLDYSTLPSRKMKLLGYR